MIQPEAWSKNNDICCKSSRFYMDKYKNLFNWKNDESILEFGMGDGRNSMESLWPYLPMNFKEYIGTDVSEIMVEYASKQATNDRMKFMSLDIACPNMPKEYINRFDHIFSFFVMHWVQNSRQAFSNMYNMLKPGGELFLFFVERTSADEVYDSLSKHPKWRKYDHERLISPFHFSTNAQKEYEKILCETGFSDYSLELKKWSYAFPSEKSFEELFFSTNPIIAEVAEQDREEYKRFYMEKMKNGSLNWASKCDETGKKIFHTSFKAFVVFAKKPLKNAD
nr:juvenile hormone acid O-methyltransferase-like [Leptinotarsa decemlineata]